MDPLFVSVSEFGRLFSISKSKASEMVLAGRVKSTFIDGRRVVPVEEVRRFAAELPRTGRRRGGCVAVAEYLEGPILGEKKAACQGGSLKEVLLTPRPTASFEFYAIDRLAYSRVVNFLRALARRSIRRGHRPSASFEATA